MATIASGSLWGIDTASDTTTQALNLAKPSTTINGAAIKFVCRYYDNFHHSTHHLSPTEAHALSGAGLQIVTVWESPRKSDPVGAEVWPTIPSYFTTDWGVLDGLDAFMIASKLGQPSGSPVYFAIDADLQASDSDALAAYIMGVKAGYDQYHQTRQAKGMPDPDYAIGVYGSGFVLKKCQAQGIATYFWQCLSSGWNDNRQPIAFANIRQHGGGLVCSIDTDYDESDGDPGGWSLPAP